MVRDYKQLFAICQTLHLEKKEVIQEFTDGRTDSLSALNDGEWKALMIQLRKLQSAKRPIAIRPGDAQRKKLIAIASKMNWGSTTIEIVSQINAFLQEQYGKELNEFDVSALSKMVWVFENKIYKDYLKGI